MKKITFKFEREGDYKEFERDVVGYLRTRRSVSVKETEKNINVTVSELPK